MKTFSKIFLFAVLMSIKSVLTGQTYNFHNYSVEDGLAQSTVISLCQTKDGTIWMGTNGGGVSRFDGKTFTTYSENDSLVNNVVFSITQLKNGNILFGTNGGLSVYNGKSFTNYTDKKGLPHNRVFRTYEDYDGIVWIATNKGVCQLKENKIIPYNVDTILNKARVRAIYTDKKHKVWFGTMDDGVIIYNPETKNSKYINTSNGLKLNTVFCIKPDIVNNVYIGTNAGARIVYPDGRIEKVDFPSSENTSFADIIFDSKQHIWYETNEGVYKSNGFYAKRFDSRNGLPGNDIRCGLIDFEGNIWFGTVGTGVSKFGNQAFNSFTTKDSLPNDYIKVIFLDSKHNLWIAMRGWGVVKLFRNKKTFYKYYGEVVGKDMLSDNEVNSITEDAEGNVIFATNRGLDVFDGNKFHNYFMKDGLINDKINYLVRDHEGAIWIATNEGVCKFRNGKFENEEKINSVKDDGKPVTIRSMYEDKKRNLWLGTERGVLKYNGKAVSRYTKKDGFTDKRVSTVIQDRYGEMWFATDDGLFNLADNKFTNLKSGTGLSSNKIYLLQLADTSLFMGTNKGLDKFDLQAYHKNKRINVRNYSKDEGFTGVECNNNSTTVDAEGNLWFGTVKGAMVYNPRLDRVNRKEAITHISGIRLFELNVDLTKYSTGYDEKLHLPINLCLPYNQNHINFDYIGICFTNPNKVKYQYKLEGADNGWFPPTSNTSATYSSLPAGDYTFYLKAMNNDNLWNKTPVTFKFTILPPWWKTWWFYTLSFIAIIAGIYLFIVVRTRNLQNQKIALENEVELRTSELREEKEKVEMINQEVSEQAAIIEAKNNDITGSIKYAKNIQEALMPPMDGVLKEMNDAFIYYLPKDIVSGDFYWFMKKNNKRFIATVDCTGHGVPGAFMSIIGNNLLNEIVSDKGITQPAEILNELHVGIKKALNHNASGNERRDGMDLALCTLNEESNVLEYAGANRPLWLFRANNKGEPTVEIIKPNKFPIGGLEMEFEAKRMFTNHTIQLEKGDLIYIFTDGFADQFGGPLGKKFMVGYFQKFLLSIYEEDVKEQKKLLKEVFNKWKGNLEQLDDVLVIAFRV